MEFSSLECKEILRNLSKNCDPEVVEKLYAGAERRTFGGKANMTTRQYEGMRGRYPQFHDQHEVDTFGDVPLRRIAQESYELGAAQQAQRERDLLGALEAARTRRTEEDRFKPPVEVLTPRLKALGFTQEDVDAVNEQRRIVYETQRRQSLIKPIVGEENASNINASFARPDGAEGRPVIGLKPGDKNSAGDTCLSVDGDGNPVFQCREGHAYTPSRYAAGCPQCFIASGGEANIRHGEDSGAIDGEESRW